MLSQRDLNRTLLVRQHLLERTSMPTLAMVEHLVGLQAQENLPPYLSLAARLDGFDPGELSEALEGGAAVRLVTLRATLHLHTVDDALALRPWVQPAVDKASAANQLNRTARHLPADEVLAATREALTAGPLPVKDLGERLAERFDGVAAAALGHRARELAPLVQVPPRGLWRRSGAVTYQVLERHVGREMAAADERVLVRRYLAAFGPATAADMTTWSRVTGLGPVFKAMADELDVVECEDGVRRYDVPGAPYADGTAPAPVRLLGTYDNLWLSHKTRDHVAPEAARRRWMGGNGGVGHVVLVDGFMAGVWWWRDGAVVTDVPQPLTRAQRAELADEVDRTTSLLAG